MHLVRAEFFRRFRLVEADKIAIVALVQRHIPDCLKTALAKLLQNEGERFLRPDQIARISDVEMMTGFFELFTRAARLFDPKLGEVDILPPGKQVFRVPLALPVAHKHQYIVHV
jgi:hypothetical protein